MKDVGDNSVGLALTIFGGCVLVAIVVLCVLALLTSAGCQTVGKLVPRQPVLAMCEDSCYESCLGIEGDTGIRWDGTPTDPAAFDALAGEVVPALTDKLRVCETHRKACTQCLNRLEKQGVIKQ